MRLQNPLVLLSTKYTMRNKREVYSFLKLEKSIKNTLLEIYNRLKEIFPNDPLILQLKKDQEDRTRYIQIIIKTSMDIEIAYIKLTKFGEEWWYNKFPDTHNKVSITIENDI